MVIICSFCSYILLFRKVGLFIQISYIYLPMYACMHADEWRKMFGHDTPNLKKLTIIHLLSQTSESSSCERNWSAFELIHTKRRNKLEHERLNDI